jgi:hypothetical protein
MIRNIEIKNLFIRTLLKKIVLSRMIMLLLLQLISCTNKIENLSNTETDIQPTYGHF